MTSGLEIKDYFFVDFDYKKGPSDRSCFYSDFRIDVGRVDSDAVSNYSIFVCTPEGIRQAMTEEKWPYLLGRNLLVVPEYDMETVIQAVSEHINELPQLATDVT